MRAIKDPVHRHKKTHEIKPYTAFIPVVHDKGNANLVDGISIDRMRYRAPLDAKRAAVKNLSRAQSKQSFAGFLVLSKTDIKSIDALSIQDLTSNIIGTEQEFKTINVSTMPDLIQMLSGFDVSPLSACTHCGVLATPMADSKRIPPADIFPTEPDGNPAHAEIFYLWKSANSNEPVGTFIQEAARHLTGRAKKCFDSAPDNAEHNPIC